MSDHVDLDDARDGRIAAICAGLLIATQVAGKATRDALFLSNFPVERLPLMVGAAGILSLMLVMVASRLLRDLGPIRLLPRTLMLSALVLVALGASAARSPKLVAVAVFLHLAVLGGMLVSGFWSALNERFDPRAARQRFGRIALGGTIGGLVGGLVAERLAALSSASAILVALGLLHLACAILLTRIPDPGRRSDTPGPAPAPAKGSWRELLRMGYLRNLATLVLIVTVAGVLLDYVFKAQASSNIRTQEALLRFFALFYTGVSLATFLVQAGVSDHLLERFGLANSVTTLPAGIALVSGLSLFMPGLASAALAKGFESTLRNSTFRSGYEPLFVPLPVEQKRRFKQFIDVGCERVGDLIGAGAVAVLIVSLPGGLLPILVTGSLALGLGGVVVTRLLHGGWVSALAGRLEDRAAQLDLEEERSTTKTVIFRTLDALELRHAPRAKMDPDGGTTSRPPSPEASAFLTLLQGGSDQIRHLLVRTPSLPATWVPLVIPLLARDEIKEVVAPALRGVAARHPGQFLDRLLDPEEDFLVRRRIPPLLGDCDATRVVDGLFLGLKDRRFEVRYQCARTLLHLRRRTDGAVFTESDRVLEAVLREVEVGKHVWEGHRLLDQADSAAKSPFDEAALRKRSALGLEHVFTLLALVLPANPLSIAYRGLFTDDTALRGTALEYLESVLPSRIRVKLWPYLDAESSSPTPTASEEEVLARLMRSHASIQLNLERQDPE
jgi:hypothetical protein